jgi:hypothetical protein
MRETLASDRRFKDQVIAKRKRLNTKKTPYRIALFPLEVWQKRGNFEIVSLIATRCSQFLVLALNV